MRRPIAAGLLLVSFLVAAGTRDASAEPADDANPAVAPQAAANPAVAPPAASNAVVAPQAASNAVVAPQAVPPVPPMEQSPDGGRGLFQSGGSAYLEGGYQHLDGDSTSAKFLDYRDFKDPAALPLADLRVRRWDIDAQLRSIDLSEKDAVYWAQLGKPGVFSLTAGWDELPRTFDDHAVTLYRTPNGNMVLIPNLFQRSLEANAANLKQFLKFLTRPVDLDMTRETTRAALTVSPLRGLTLSVDADDAQRRGKVARSVSTNFFNGPDVTEWASPVDDRTRRGTFLAQYVFGKAMIAGTATVSEYSDRVGPLLVDNPLRATDAEGLLFGHRSAAQFLVSQPLDDRAKQFGLEAAIDLPWRMKLSGTLTSGSIEATHDFLPYTSNSAVKANFFYPALPARTYEGKVDTTNYSAALTGTPLEMISFKVFARGYEYDNRTPAYLFPAYVVGDTRLAVIPRVALPYGWKRDGQGAEIRVHPVPELTFSLGLDHEVVQRTFREVNRSSEKTVRGSAGWQAQKWLFMKATYSDASRTGDDYDPNAYTESFPGGVPGDQKQFLLMKRYDVADRSRKLVDLLADFEFTESFSFDWSARYSSDDYSKSSYGLEDNSTREHVLGVSFAPFSPCKVRIERGNGFDTQRVNARLRNLLFGQPADSPFNDWSDEISKKTYTTTADAQCSPEDASWDFGIGLALSSDRQTDDASFAPNSYIDPGLQGHARPYPPTKRSFRQTHSRARFRMTRAFDLVLNVSFEEFEEMDRTQDVMSAPMGRYDRRAFESAYLGVRVDSYSTVLANVFLAAHW